MLSEQRAEAVRAWLVQHGVPSDKLVARGYGQERPLAPNVTARQSSAEPPRSVHHPRKGGRGDALLPAARPRLSVKKNPLAWVLSLAPRPRPFTPAFGEREERAWRT